MPGSRFVFLTRRVADDADNMVTWMLVSPNSRPLGRAVSWFDDLATCRADAVVLRERRAELNVTIGMVKEVGHWNWRIDYRGAAVAVSSRTYLRQQETKYNVRRFLEALSTAELAMNPRVIGWRKPDGCTG